MEAREFNFLDYPEIFNWWQEHNMVPVARECLPGLGLFVPGLAVAFLYKTDSKLALIEWELVNPNADKQERRQALKLIIEQLIERAKAEGFTFVFSSSAHAGLTETYKDLDFIETDKNMSYLARRI